MLEYKDDNKNVDINDDVWTDEFFDLYIQLKNKLKE